MESVYITKAGQEWDEIAREVYGNESYTSFLMKNNLEYIRFFKFPAGVKIRVVELPQEANTLPSWRS